MKGLSVEVPRAQKQPFDSRSSSLRAPKPRPQNAGCLFEVGGPKTGSGSGLEAHSLLTTVEFRARRGGVSSP